MQEITRERERVCVYLWWFRSFAFSERFLAVSSKAAAGLSTRAETYFVVSEVGGVVVK